MGVRKDLYSGHGHEVSSFKEDATYDAISLISFFFHHRGLHRLTHCLIHHHGQ